MSQSNVSAKNGRRSKEQVRKLTLAAMLTAVVVVLALLGTAIKFGTFNINLALVPIVIGAALLGVAYGAWFGFVNAMGNFCIFGIEGEATVQVIDMLGHVISSETFSGSYERKINGAPGVYLVRLIHGNDVKVQKVVVR